MQSRTEKTILKSAILVTVGLAPMAYLCLWWGNPIVVEPLSSPITIKSGEYVSPYFTTYVADQYQIDLYFLPIRHAPMDIDWKIVNDRGAIIADDEYKEERNVGNNAILGYYRSARWSRQRIILSIHQDSDDKPFDTALHIGMPERSLDLSYGILPLLAWAILWSGIASIVLVFDLRRR
jgi:hypothetical protein